MVNRAQVEAAGPIERARVSVRPDEVVIRGSAIRIELDTAIPPESVGGVAVAGQRANVVLRDDGRVVTVDTSSLPVGPHQLRIEELFPSNGRAADQERAVPFVVVGSMARLPEDVVVHHAARLRITDLEVERLTMDGSADAAFVDVFKAEGRTSGEPLQLAFDERGEPVDVDEQLRALEERRHRHYGKVHPTLHEAIRKTDGERIPVAVWLVVQEEVVDKPTKGIRRRPAHEVEAAERSKEVALGFVDRARDYGFEMERVDEAAPILYGSLPAEQISRLAERDEVAGIFLYETMGELDLINSIGIANSDDAQSSGVTGKAVNVAVYEDGPDNTSNLTITAQYLATPATSATRATPTASSRTSRLERRTGTLQTATSFRQQQGPRRHPLGGPGPRVHGDQPELPPHQRADHVDSVVRRHLQGLPRCTGPTRRSARRPATARPPSTSTTRGSTG